MCHCEGYALGIRNSCGGILSITLTEAEAKLLHFDRYSYLVKSNRSQHFFFSQSFKETLFNGFKKLYLCFHVQNKY